MIHYNPIDENKIVKGRPCDNCLFENNCSDYDLNFNEFVHFAYFSTFTGSDLVSFRPNCKEFQDYLAAKANDCRICRFCGKPLFSARSIPFVNGNAFIMCNECYPKLHATIEIAEEIFYADKEFDFRYKANIGNNQITLFDKDFKNN